MIPHVKSICYSRLSVDISDDGYTLAIGSDTSILALKWNGTHYTQYLNSLPSGESSAVSLSRDGNAMAVDRPLSGGGGVTTVYKVRLQGCSDNTKLLRISFTTDDTPEENRWTLHVGNETIKSQPFDQLQELMTFVEEICVPDNDKCIKLRVFDTAGNGMKDPGGYSVMLDGVKVANGGDFRFTENGDNRFVETKYITGNCDYCSEKTTLLSIVARTSSNIKTPMAWALSYQNSTLAEVYVFNHTMDYNVEIFEECIPEGCWHLTNPLCHGSLINDDDAFVSDDWWYNVTYKGWSENKHGKGSDYFCPRGDETISFGECLPGENAVVNYRTNSPTISISPTSSPKPTLCTDTPDWVDAGGEGCGSYEDTDLPGCPKYGNDPAWLGDMGYASENCCYCFPTSNQTRPLSSITTLTNETVPSPSTISPPLLFQGTLLNQQGNAIPNAKIQLWQTDSNGNYDHPYSYGSTMSNFQYFGTDTTESNGNFDFLTYRPAVYADRPAHFHLMVWVEDDKDTPALVTQFYFTDDPLSLSRPEMLRLNVTEVDSNLYSYGSYVNGTIVIDGKSSLAIATTDGDESLLVLTPDQPKGPYYPVSDFFSMDNDLTVVDDAVSMAEDSGISTENALTSTLPSQMPSVLPTVFFTSASPIIATPQSMPPTKPTIFTLWDKLTTENDDGKLSQPTTKKLTTAPTKVPSSANPTATPTTQPTMGQPTTKKPTTTDSEGNVDGSNYVKLLD
jgi:protocatechuate 3,4-dioxygenase beta subunit